MKNAQTTDRKRIEDMIQTEPKGEVRINHKIQKSGKGKKKSPHIAARDGADRQKTMYTLVHGTAGGIVRAIPMRSTEEEHRANALALGAEEGRDKLRKAAGRSTYPLIRGCPNGETHMSKPHVS